MIISMLIVMITESNSWFDSGEKQKMVFQIFRPNHLAAPFLQNVLSLEEIRLSFKGGWQCGMT